MSLTICPQIHLPLLWRICTFMCASMLKDLCVCVCVCVSVYTWRFPCLYVDFVIYREQSLETFTFIAGWRISVLRCKQTHTHTHTHTHTAFEEWSRSALGSIISRRSRGKKGLMGKQMLFSFDFIWLLFKSLLSSESKHLWSNIRRATDTVWLIHISNLKTFKMAFAYWWCYLNIHFHLYMDVSITLDLERTHYWCPKQIFPTEQREVNKQKENEREGCVWTQTERETLWKRQ